jgi:tetratricopeptide (TPR) repeat protein
MATVQTWLPVWKKMLFATLAVAAFFCLLEGLFALAGVRPVIDEGDPFVGFSGTLPLLVPDASSTAGSQMITAPNKRGLFNLQRFADPKPAGTYRIFCLGGSTTYGHPYDDRTSFAGWLRELLPCVDASRRWEVINAGGISYASYREAALVEELCRYQPDLFILFTGHNEFLEERTYGSLQELPAPLLRVSGVLAQTRTYSALWRLLKPKYSRPQRVLLPAEVDAVLDHSVGPSAYHRDTQLRRQIVDHFEFNLRRMTRLARAAGAEVLLVTPVSNLKDCSPFKSQHGEGLAPEEQEAWSTMFQRGRKLQAAGELQSALEAFDAAIALDDEYAEAHYRRGQCLLELGRFDEAQAALLRARDEDVCPLRATAPLVEGVRRAAAAEAAPLIDFERLLDEECQRRFGHATAGRELFLDHVHPTIAVNRLLAESIVDELGRSGVARPGDAWRERCLAATQQSVLSQLTPADHATAHRMVAKVLSWAGKLEEAGPAALAALEIAPQDRESLFIAGAYMKFVGRDEEGHEYFRQALEIEVAENPQDAEARQFLAETLAKQERWEEARKQFEAALRLNGDSAAAHRGLAEVLRQLDMPDEAQQHRRAAEELDRRSLGGGPQPTNRYNSSPN